MQVQCGNCSVLFNKNKFQMSKSKSGLHFCSRKCSAIITNKMYDKKKKKKIRLCKYCQASLIGRKTVCILCSRGQDMTLKDAIYIKHHKSSAYCLVRARARVIAKTQNWNSCHKCGYNKHIEIAHIKPIYSFDEGTMISEINSLSNLLPLCPNCHWEFDNLSN